MLERFYWKEHKGVLILVNDYSNLTCEEANRLVPLWREKILDLHRRDILFFMDVTNLIIDHVLSEQFTTAAKSLSPVFRASAITGLTNYKSLILKIVNSVTQINIKAFPTQDDAINFLVNEFKEIGKKVA
ncbi:MAG: hypothetical protein HQK52_20695 [Oligoflexia bacterium]|nr:hypothetical protein [Oligoflexia bacterium]